MTRHLALLSAVAILFSFAGCVASEKSRYMRHLTTAVEPSDEIPEEVILTFDIDRKKLPATAVVSAPD